MIGVNLFQYSLQVIYVMMIGMNLFQYSIAAYFASVMGLHVLVLFTNFDIDFYFAIIGYFTVYKVIHDVSFLEKCKKRGMAFSIVVFVLP